MFSEAMFRQYVSAFNAGNHSAYSGFYAPDIVMRNGAGAKLYGAEAIVDYYKKTRSSMARVMEIEALVVAPTAMSAALASRFTILSDGVEFAGRALSVGDQVAIRSIALYELVNDRIASINATTLQREYITGIGEANG